MRVKIFNFLFKIAAACKIKSQKFHCTVILKIKSFMLKHEIIRLYFHFTPTYLHLNFILYTWNL